MRIESEEKAFGCFAVLIVGAWLTFWGGIFYLLFKLVMWVIGGGLDAN